MEKAQAAVKDFMSRSGKHDTTVHERVTPAVTHENRLPERHENVTTAVDKEIHQDHYHTSVQPIHDKVRLPEEHSHNLVGVEHRNFEHGDKNEVEKRLSTEAAKFKDEATTQDVKHTHAVQPVVTGEHIHHHVHETIQPVVQREVVQPSVVHTTVPIHEVHHNSAQHHTTSALPPVTMDDFKNKGGVLTGREERSDAFEGEPRSVGGTLSEGSQDYESPRGKTSLKDRIDPRTDTSSRTGTNAGTTTGGLRDDLDSSRRDYDDTTRDSRRDYDDTTRDSTTGKKPSLIERMDPRKDTDGDGKKGIMS